MRLPAQRRLYRYCRSVVIVDIRPKVRHAGIPSTCNPMIFRATDSTESVVVSQSSMDCVASSRIISTDVHAFIGNISCPSAACGAENAP
jgi:hypothetical protein